MFFLLWNNLSQFKIHFQDSLFAFVLKFCTCLPYFIFQKVLNGYCSFSGRSETALRRSAQGHLYAPTWKQPSKWLEQWSGTARIRKSSPKGVPFGASLSCLGRDIVKKPDASRFSVIFPQV